MFDALLSTSRTKLRSVAIAAMTWLLVGLYSPSAMAQRYLSEIVVSTTNTSVAPIIPPELKFGSALNAYLLVDTAQLNTLVSWYGSNSKTPSVPLNGVLSTDRAALETTEAKLLIRRGTSQIMVIAISNASLSAAGIGPQNLAAPRNATLVGTVSSRASSSQLNVGQGQLRF